jgi:RimJ/RimL family protein N-acetyltransferase
MIYATARLYVREMTIDDIPTLRKTLQDEQTMYAYAHAFTDAEVNTWLANNLRRYQEDGFGLWAVIRKADQEFIGQCGHTVHKFANQQVVEIGYLLQREYWGQGYAIEAARG